MPPSRSPDELGPFYRRASYRSRIRSDGPSPRPEQDETDDSPPPPPDDPDSSSPSPPPDGSDTSSLRADPLPPPGPDRHAQTLHQDEAWRPAAASDRPASAGAPTPPDEASRRAAVSNGGAVAGFVLGVFSFIPLLGTIVGVLGILLSRRGLSRSRLEGAPYGRLAMAGFVLSIIATSLNGLLWVIFLIGVLVGAEGS